MALLGKDAPVALAGRSEDFAMAVHAVAGALLEVG